MKVRANGISNLAARFRALALPAITGLVLLCPCASWARSQGTAKSAPAARSALASKAAPQAKQVAATKPPAKGLNTGITVHGWWKIDVRNPDGKLVAHREFENGLFGGNGDGASLLTSLLARQFVLGGWTVELDDTYNTTTQVGASAYVGEPNSGNVNSYCGLASLVVYVSCSTNLSITSQGTATISNPNNGTSVSVSTGSLVFSGSVIWPTGGPVQDTITAVRTVNAGICTPTTSATSCFSDNGSNTPAASIFTGRSLDGLNGDPAAVPVTPGQTVTVAVTYTFTSQ